MVATRVTKSVIFLLKVELIEFIAIFFCDFLGEGGYMFYYATVLAT